MADQAKSWSSISTDLTAGTAGNITVQKLRDALYSQRVFGQLQATNGSTSQTGVGTSYVAVSNLSNSGIAVGVTEDSTTSKLTVPCDGIYKVQATITHTATVSTSILTFAALKNGEATTPNGPAATIDAAGTGTTQIANFEYIASLSASDYLILMVKANASSKAVTIKEASFSIERVA